MGGTSAAVPKLTKVAKDVDFANYFCTYAFLYHQKDMLSDHVRMDAYYGAVFENARHFRDKVVLDVGTGSGILAIWAAKAGARKVYAVEATDMAKHAVTLIQANGVGHIVEVIQESVEDISLPEKVDIIISEWMGYFLLRESMFDSVLHARDKWLKPGGAMYPSHARMYVAPVRTAHSENKYNDFDYSVANWRGFSEEMANSYGVDMRSLTSPFVEEQRKFYLQTSQWSSLGPDQVVGRPAVILDLNCLTCTAKDIEELHSHFSCPIFATEHVVSGIAGWFDVQFRGSPSQPADSVKELSTAPSESENTHWGQQVFLLHPTVQVRPGDVFHGTVDITRSKQNHRLMDVRFSHGVGRCPLTVSDFKIE